MKAAEEERKGAQREDEKAEKARTARRSVQARAATDFVLAGEWVARIGLHPMHVTEPPVRLIYAGFGQRLLAGLIDSAVFLPVLVLYYWVGAGAAEGAFTAEVLYNGLWIAYVVYGHGRFGQTIGKRVMRIRVVRVDGSSLGWNRAWARCAVDIVFSVVQICGGLVALTAMDRAGSEQLDGGIERSFDWLDHEPVWSEMAGWLWLGWVGSEVVVMLFNERRRALHDFIAGSVVVAEPRGATAS